MIEVYIRATNQVDNVRIFQSNSKMKAIKVQARTFAQMVSKYDKFIVDVWEVSLPIGGAFKLGSEVCIGRFKEGKEILLVGDLE